MRKHLAGMLIHLAHKIHPPKVTKISAREMRHAGQRAGMAIRGLMEQTG